MVRKLKHHEQKLLKKVDFLNWKQDNGHRDVEVMRRYHVQNREDYHKYNKIVGEIKKLARKLSLLSSSDPVRIKHEQLLMEKLYSMGVLNTTTKISALENKVTVAALCRRRISVLMHRLKMAETISDAVKFLEQGHVRVGPDIVTDPAFLVTRDLEDYVTWADGSKIKRNIAKYKNAVDDFELVE